MASAKVGMATSDGVEVTNSKGCCIRGTADLSDKCIVILREGRARTAVEPLYQMVTAQSEKLRRHAPMRAHSFSGHDVSPYATVGAISPIIQHHPFRHPSQVRGRLQSLPAPLSPPSPSRMYSGPPLSPAIRRPAFAPHVSPAPTRVHPMSPPQSPALQRGPSPPRMEASIINPFICSLVLLEKVQQDGDSIVAVAESKEEENVQQTRKLFRVKVAFVRTDIKGFRHPFENEVLILQRLRGQSSHLSSNHVVPSTCLAYCKTREDLSLLHRTMHHEITHAFELLMNFTPGKVFVCVYPLALDTLWEKALVSCVRLVASTVWSCLGYYLCVLVSP